MIFLLAGICVVLLAVCMLLAAGLAAGFMVPSVVAVQRGHRHWLLIVLANVFLAWTVIGWALILIWACLGPYDCKCRSCKAVV